MKTIFFGGEGETWCFRACLLMFSQQCRGMPSWILNFIFQITAGDNRYMDKTRFSEISNIQPLHSSKRELYFTFYLLRRFVFFWSCKILIHRCLTFQHNVSDEIVGGACGDAASFVIDNGNVITYEDNSTNELGVQIHCFEGYTYQIASTKHLCSPCPDAVYDPPEIRDCVGKKYFMMILQLFKHFLDINIYCYTWKLPHA